MINAIDRFAEPLESCLLISSELHYNTNNEFFITHTQWKIEKSYSNADQTRHPWISTPTRPLIGTTILGRVVGSISTLLNKVFLYFYECV